MAKSRKPIRVQIVIVGLGTGSAFYLFSILSPPVDVWFYGLCIGIVAIEAVDGFRHSKKRVDPMEVFFTLFGIALVGPFILGHIAVDEVHDKYVTWRKGRVL